MERSYYVIDAFTNERYAGNPAAVVFDAEGLDEVRMQAIAAEFNLSETTFILPPETSQAVASHSATVRFRWFTPTVEVAMCGHATIAGVYALVESGRLRHENPAESTTIAIDTLSGTLAAFVESIPGSDSDLMIWLDMPKPILVEQKYTYDELAAVLNVPADAFELSLPIVKTQDNDLLVFVKDFITLNDARPDFAKLLELQTRDRMRGLSLATVKTVTPSVHVQSRFFAPAAGVNEDPVTGSVHGPLAAYLVMHGLAPVQEGMAGLTCVQGKPGGRAGLIHALVRQESDGTCSVRTGGRAVTTMRGTLVE